MTWILLLVMHVHSGTSVATQEFNTKAACEYARMLIIEAEPPNNRGWSDVRESACIPKGETDDE